MRCAAPLTYNVRAHMPQESVTFATSKEVKKALAENEEIFRYCHFETAKLEGGDSDGVFLSCTFKGFEWYWGIFNLALFVGCKFERCTFRSTAFSGCRFVECSFTECHFLPDNLGGLCRASETNLYGCSSTDCVGFNELFQNQEP
ncbi:pentapeptide repeat-containing protein [Ferribacterium limneticum]|uniref:pentapeptide repeat-containing protein n=1 Tax=Ferribacterium limneticum TaxID=76259 RepID=UPI00384A529E